MTSKKQLIELTDHFNIESWKTQEYMVDYLLEHGVIVPPCKVGDTVYVIESNEIISCTVFSIDYNAWGIPTNLYLRYSEFNGCAFIPMQCTDGFVFLTREEAEKALKERANK
ncbi:MAG: hypothetical protein ACI4I6_07635 [Hominimerdicola sp.]